MVRTSKKCTVQSSSQESIESVERREKDARLHRFPPLRISEPCSNVKLACYCEGNWRSLQRSTPFRRNRC
jgi:hypothetical protein